MWCQNGEETTIFSFSSVRYFQTPSLAPSLPHSLSYLPLSSILFNVLVYC